MDNINYLISAAQNSQNLDVIAHNTNCFCTMTSEVSLQMNKAFNCNDGDYFLLENPHYSGDIKKLGQIESANRPRQPLKLSEGTIKVVNYYGQFHSDDTIEYAAIKLCFIKMNYLFKGLKIGLPGLLLGKDGDILSMIENELYDCTIII